MVLILYLCAKEYGMTSKDLSEVFRLYKELYLWYIMGLYLVVMDGINSCLGCKMVVMMVICNS